MDLNPVIDTDLESVLAAESDADAADESWRDMPVDDLWDLSDDLIDALKRAKILTAEDLAKTLAEDATLDRFGEIPLMHRIDAVTAVEEVSGLSFDPKVPRCRLCRCREFDSCDGEFRWVEPDLCNACEWLKHGLPSFDSIPSAEGDRTGSLARELGIFGLNRPPSPSKRDEKITAALEDVGGELRGLEYLYAEQSAFWPEGPAADTIPEPAPDGIDGANGWILHLNHLRGRIAMAKACASCLTAMRQEVLDEIATAAEKKSRTQAPSPSNAPRLTDEQRRALAWMRDNQKATGETRFSAKSVQANAATMAALCKKGYLELPTAGERSHGHAAAEMRYRLLPAAGSEAIPAAAPTINGTPAEIEAGITPGWRGESLVELAGDEFDSDVSAERWAELVRESLGLRIDQEPTVGHVVDWLDSGKRSLHQLIPPGPNGELLVLCDVLEDLWTHDFEMQREVKPGWIRQSMIGYEPSHPWYYKLGGKPLPVDEIAAVERLDSWIENIVATERIPDAPAKRRAKLESLIEGAEKALKRDIESYEVRLIQGRVEDPGEEEDVRSASSYDSSMSLAHNHVCSSRTRLAALRQLLADVESTDLAKFQQMTRNKLAENDRSKGGRRAVSR